MLDSIKANLTEAEAVALAIFEGITADESGECLAPLDKAAYELFIKFGDQEFSLLGLDEDRQQFYVYQSINFSLSSLGDIQKVPDDQIPKLTQRVMHLQRLYEIDASARDVFEYTKKLAQSGTDPNSLGIDTLISQAIDAYSHPHIAAYIKSDEGALAKIKTLTQTPQNTEPPAQEQDARHADALAKFDHTNAPVQ